MKTQKRGLSAPLIALGLLTACGLGFTSLHTIHFVSQTFDKSQQLGAYIALGLLDGGVLTWLCVFIYHARTEGERAIAKWMIAVDLIGVAVATLGDMLTVTGDNGTTSRLDSGIIFVAIVAIAVIVLSNVLAGVAYKAADPDAQDEIEERKLEGEGRALLRDARRAARLGVIQEIAPDIAAHEAANVRAALLGQQYTTRPSAGRAVESFANSVEAPALAEPSKQSRPKN